MGVAWCWGCPYTLVCGGCPDVGLEPRSTGAHPVARQDSNFSLHASAECQGLLMCVKILVHSGYVWCQSPLRKTWRWVSSEVEYSLCSFMGELESRGNLHAWVKSDSARVTTSSIPFQFFFHFCAKSGCCNLSPGIQSSHEVFLYMDGCWYWCFFVGECWMNLPLLVSCWFPSSVLLNYWDDVFSYIFHVYFKVILNI